QTSQRTRPTRRLDHTTKPISPSSTAAVTHDVHFISSCAYATARPRSSAADSGLDSPPGLDYERPRAMGSPIFIGSAFVAQYPTGGGVFWVLLQYLLGLRELGHDAWWLELLWTRGDATRDRESIDTFRRQAEAFGVADRIVLLHLPDSTRDGAQGRVEYLGLDEAGFAARRRDALLINVANSVTAPY